MRKDPHSNPRFFVAVTLCRLGVLLAMLGFASGPTLIGAPNEGVQGNWHTFALPFPPPRGGLSFAFDPIRQQLVAFGGATSEQFGDTWLFIGTTWTQATPATAPSARSFAGMAYDPATRTILLFGGHATNLPDQDLLGDTWSWDGTTWTQLQPATSPPARYGAAMTTDPATGTILLFGGSDRADTWRWDGTTWIELHPLNPPSARTAPTAAADALRNQVVLFGGYDATAGRGLPDTHIWDGQNWHPATAAGPAGRAYSGLAPDANGNLVLFGGQDTGFTEHNDMWTWNGISWTAQTPNSSPTARDAMGMVFDPTTGRTVLFGGKSYSQQSGFTYYDDTWAWDGSNWTKPPVRALPPRRSEMGLATDATGAVIVFGGWNGFGNLGDTWVWNNGVWTERAPSISPPARSLAAMAFDSATNRTVMFGGFNSAGLGDTWTWDGTNWTLQSPASSPTPRYGAGIVVDPMTGHPLLFGGTAVVGGTMNETWTWDGNTWTQLHPEHAPPARYRPGMVANPASGTVVLFGGFGVGTTLRDDTWIWNGADWQQVVTAASPSPRYSAVLGFDAATNTVILFGGGTLGAALDDTWSWDGSSWTELQPSAAPSTRWSSGVWSNPGGGVLLFGGEDRGLGGLRDTWLWSVTSSVQLNRIVSRKTHGAAGDFDIDLPITGDPGIECRSGVNGDYTIVFSFASTLTSVGGASVSSGSGSVNDSGIGTDPHEYIVNLTGVTNTQVITVSLTNVNDAAGNSSAGGISASMALLLGDVNGNGTVSNTDVASVKSQVAAPVISSNFRNDVNANGVITNTDVSTAKGMVGTALP
jgi:hypothetical protein